MVRARGKNGGETIGEERVLGQVWRVIVEEEDQRENERKDEVKELLMK